ncbi:hypothetical protein MMC14_007271 [Varicellaria rhodocarpa]|nr:hypothetical protein [Varicellaria rhodocarpa]
MCPSLRPIPLAKLERVLPLPFIVEGHENTTPEEEWDSQTSDTGLVALTDDYVASMNLPQAQRFPWDATKGIYFLQGHHNLHCLKLVRKAIFEYRNDSKQTEHYLHVDHCLTVLREDILCNADDTPRYTGGHHKQPGSGQGQTRLCRDWTTLDEWAKERSACFKTPETWFDGKPNTDRYKSCPDGSQPWKAIQKGSAVQL